jgi:hypothetical protein
MKLGKPLTYEFLSYIRADIQCEIGDLINDNVDILINATASSEIYDCFTEFIVVELQLPIEYSIFGD